MNGVGMVLSKILVQCLSSYQTLTKSIKGFGNNEVLKTLTFVDADANANANANADAGGIDCRPDGHTLPPTREFCRHTLS